MIDDPHPKDRKDLQARVCRLFNEIGLSAEIEKVLNTPRGEVEVDGRNLYFDEWQSKSEVEHQELE